MFAREEEKNTIIVTKKRRKEGEEKRYQNIEQEDGLLKEHIPG